jgi:hypothetical protein
MLARDDVGATSSGSYFHHRGNRDRKLSSRARDDELARRLWAVSEELVAAG